MAADFGLHQLGLSPPAPGERRAGRRGRRRRADVGSQPPVAWPPPGSESPWAPAPASSCEPSGARRYRPTGSRRRPRGRPPACCRAQALGLGYRDCRSWASGRGRRGSGSSCGAQGPPRRRTLSPRRGRDAGLEMARLIRPGGRQRRRPLNTAIGEAGAEGAWRPPSSRDNAGWRAIVMPAAGRTSGWAGRQPQETEWTVHQLAARTDPRVPQSQVVGQQAWPPRIWCVCSAKRARRSECVRATPFASHKGLRRARQYDSTMVPHHEQTAQPRSI
jgi:hypothetical protein